MKINILLAVLLTMAIPSIAQQVKYSISGTYTNNGVKIYLKDKLTNHRIDSVVVADGKFSFVGSAEKDALMTIKAKDVNWVTEFFNDGTPVMININDSTLKGSPQNERLAKYSVESDIPERELNEMMDRMTEDEMNAKEEEKEQKAVIAFSGIMFLAAFIVAGLNFRFQWTVVPRWLVALGAAVFLLSYALYAEVLRENEYLSRTVEVQENQKVIDTGMYGVVRHPMYAVTVWLFLSMALVLGSLPSLIVMLIYPALLIRRILNEEKVLEEGLPGYREYEKKVKWRLIPFIW